MRWETPFSRWARDARSLLVAAFLGTALGAPAAEELVEVDPDARWFAEHYTKSEHLVPMRDGVRLHTTVYLPKAEGTPQPILLMRTPYGNRPYGSSTHRDPAGSFAAFARDGFILAQQDVRGRNGSEGEFEHVRPFRPGKQGQETDESSDAWDTIEWLVRQVPNNNGRVGMWGISYPGFYTSMGMIDSHPALRAASPQAPIADWFIGDDFHHNGAFFLAHAFSFLAGFGQTLENPTRDQPRPFDYRTPDGYAFFLGLGPLARIERDHFRGRIAFWSTFADHPTYDAFWQARNVRPHLRNVRCAVLNVGGWYDAEDLFGALETYRSTEQFNPGLTNLLVVGPWAHGDWGRRDGDRLGALDFRARTGVHYRQRIELPFFRRHLRDDTNTVLPEVSAFETGTWRWRHFDQWPPAGTPATLHLHEGGRLSTRAADGAPGFDMFVSDPSRPVPVTDRIHQAMPRDYMTADQRFAARRPDVLVYATEPLEEDLTLAGPVEVELQVTTTGTDADWIVKLIDVYDGDYPDPEPNPEGHRMGGYQQLVRGEPMRGRFRNSFEHPEPFEPGKVARVKWTMPDILHTFRRGHRVMVQVQSTWFPLIDRNPQTFVDPWKAEARDFQPATHRVQRGGPEGSRLRVHVVRGTLPGAGTN